MNLFNYIESLIDKVKSNKRKDNVVIAIAGAGCIGKTTFAQRFQRFIGVCRCQIIALDGYMLERDKRIKLGNITGYNPDGFELKKARKQLYGLIKHDIPFILNQYNRKTHQRDIPQLIEPKEIIVIEGGLSLRDELYNLADIHIFLDSNKKTQFILRLKREKKEFRYTKKEVTKRFERYYQDYLYFIYPAKKSANIILTVDDSYNIYFSDKSKLCNIKI